MEKEKRHKQASTIRTRLNRVKKSWERGGRKGGAKGNKGNGERGDGGLIEKDKIDGRTFR